jgi:hypothetical protein
LYHFLECNLHELFDALIWVFFGWLLDKAVFEELKHLFAGNEAVAVQVVHAE